MNTYRTSSDSIDWSRPWVIWAVVLALAFHALLFALFYFLPLKQFGDPYFERLVPRTFRVERIIIDSKLLDVPEAQEPAVETPEVTRIEIDAEAPGAELQADVRAVPSAPPDPEIDLSQKPLVASSNIDAAMLEAQNAAALQPSSMADLSTELLDTMQDTAGRPTIQVPSATGGSVSGMGEVGFSNLDQLLDQGESVADGAPILMDSGVLFGYDSADLGDAAAPSLKKLAILIMRSPGAQVIIEGHSDSVGSFEYNMTLSQRRALSVKNWLTSNFNIDPAQISTTGYGNTRLIAPATGDIDSEAINRRVEILIQTPQ